MSDIYKLLEQAKAIGFDVAEPLDCSKIELLSEVRDMCKSNKCGAYDNNWSCPPGCGTLEECRERIGKYKRGMIVQTIGELEDEFDFEGIKETSERHKKTFYKLTYELRKEYPTLLALGAGACTHCKTCSYPSAPCRAPEYAVSSMESYGMVVSDVCKNNNVPYYYGRGKQVFVGCYLID